MDKNYWDLNQTRQHIEQYDCSIILVEGTNYFPPFAYSVGLLETLKHPEIICFGLQTQLMHEIINDVVEIIRKDGSIKTNTDYTNIFHESRAQFLKVDQRNVADYYSVALVYYKPSQVIDAIQLVWTDRNDRFPWENDFEKMFQFKQPLLDRNAEFKFLEEKNLGIFTTSEWQKIQKPILRVVHDLEGDWQFFTKNPDFDNGIVVALGEMIANDPSLNEVFDLDYGESGERNFIGDEWKRSKLAS